MNITAAQVNELRNRTGAGILDCKKALVESQGDMDQAIDYLRKKGAAMAAKRADRAANEGRVSAKISDNKKFGVLVEVNCETDFVAKSEAFVEFSKKVTDLAFEKKVKSSQELIDTTPEIGNMLNDLTAKIGEKLEISRISSLETENGVIDYYIHYGDRLGSLVRFDNIDGEKIPAVAQAVQDVAKQVAAMSPISISRDKVPAELIEKELEIYKEQFRKEGKPEDKIEFIAKNKLGKYFEEVALYEQSFFREDKKTVGAYLEEVNKANGTKFVVESFVRFNLGEGSK
ncbi:MAG: elongation factor Ts [Ignavibacteriales bacterium]|jgi:elongation factor Ts|nr:elongation factor Ts [Ignavibacteriales bacterium]MBK7266051.1 elongation factor Ts [Ignavibacteriales bacterium]MBK8663954.1 elongation factor Ts [Ignavibacteriales bacterium]MBP7542820.1 elongation factor Ts [Ignavibacteriaceae bacterium]MBP9121931.1 elongation factor Ts [Ignavibacteriaceae bacterium]